ncbi:MAG: metallophosphoesterase, partial [Bryobacteraceae bacterium]
MSIARTLVSHRRMVRPFGNQRRMVARTRPAAALGPKGEEMLARLDAGLSALHASETDSLVLSTSRQRDAALIQSFVAAEATRTGKVDVLQLPGEVPFTGFEVRFSEQDWLGWAASIFTWWGKIVPHSFVEPPPGVEAIPNSFRISMLGDWGTGLYGAPFCARSIEADPPDLVLHLGDVYYSGTRAEVQERFLALWPNVPGAMHRALNGNHEMYTGGHSYFDDILPRFGQAASCFALQNDFWTLIGLDSAYEDHSLHESQIPWLTSVLAGAGDRKIVLFSHHQPFSLLEDQGPALAGRLREVLESRRIYAWYWGHEHRCVLYDPHPRWGLRGRCAGHSGFPYFRDDLRNAPRVRGLNDGWHRIESIDGVPGALLLDSPNVYVAGF